MKTTAEILADVRERMAVQQDYEREAQNEALRQRTLTEAQALIDKWRKQYRRKTKVMRISIVAQFFPAPVSKKFYKIRLFYAGNLEAIFNLEEQAALHLTTGVKADALGGLDFYTLYDSHE